MTAYNIKEIAERIEEMRGIIGFQQEEVAEAAGISLEEYKEFVGGEKDFPFGFLYHCAEKFGIDMVELITGENPHLSGYTLVRQGAGLPIYRQDGFDYYHLAAHFKNKLSEPFMVRAPYHEELQSRPIELSCHEGQEFNFVVTGRLRFTYEGRIEELDPGDSIYYDSSRPHGMIATGGEDCIFLAVVIDGEMDEQKAAAHPVHLGGTEERQEKQEKKKPERKINLRYVDESYDENGLLESYKIKYPENYNFGYDVVDDIAENDPDRKAMVWCDPSGAERVFTFADIKRYSNKTANYLKDMGIGKGDLVLLVQKRNFEFWYTIVALHKLGAVAVPATFMLTSHDVEYRVNAGKIKAVICTGQCDVPNAVDEVLDKCPTLKTRIISRGQRDGWSSFDKGVEEASEELERIETKALEPMLIFFSSGTSGYPKMVLHNHTYTLGHLYTAKHWHNVSPNGLHFTIADTGWGKAVWGKLYGQWLMESAVLTYDYDKFVPAEILSLIGKYKVTSLCVPPTMYRMMLSDKDIEKYDLSSLSYCTTAGEALNPDVFRKWKNLTGITIMEGFGQTETTVALCNFVGMNPKPGSLGKPSHQYPISLIDEDGFVCPTGKTGEIVINIKEGKAVGLLDCYYLNEEKTAEALRGGYYHTGDTAWKDEDGYYWYVGRNDDIIKSSGYRIGPFEIESVLMEHPAVAECAVTGVPDAVRGQLVKATIVLNPGFEQSKELESDLQSFVKKNTAPYKYPRVIDFVDILPKTVNGKIRRVDIRQKDLEDS